MAGVSALARYVLGLTLSRAISLLRRCHVNSGVFGFQFRITVMGGTVGLR